VYINIHTHSPTLLPSVFELGNVYFGQKQAPKAPKRSVGLHPWYLSAETLDAAFAWLDVQGIAPEVLAIGEAGLDKLCATPWDLQLLAFQRCMEVSERLEKPLILHCVRAYAEIIALKKAWKPRQTWIFHGFDKNTATAEMVLRAGCMLSFGAGLFRAKSHAPESLRATPADRFFLETDDAEMSIEAVYARAAEIRKISVADLGDQLQENFNNLK
jgi:TatD DNase family protein